MGILDKYISAVQNRETVVILDDVVKSLEESFLRSIPFVKMAKINTVTFPMTKGKIFSTLSIDDISWRDSRKLIKNSTGGFAVYTNQWLENIWTSKTLLDKSIDHRDIGIILIMPNKKFTLNQAMRPFIEENHITTNYVFSYSVLLDELYKKTQNIFNIKFNDRATPLFLESLCYLAFFDNEYPTTKEKLLESLDHPRNHYLDSIMKKLTLNPNKFNFEDIVDALFWQIGGNKKDISILIQSWINSKRFMPTEYISMEKKRKENIEEIISKVSGQPDLKAFFSRNCE